MTREEFENLQSSQVSSGFCLMDYLRREGISYSNYRYWRSKYSASSPTPLAPVLLKKSPSSQSSDIQGVTLAFPNGIRAHFGKDCTDSAMVFLRQIMQSNVQSE
ncbi:MAG: hypothetical protein IJK50_06725 [Prevotella sp.]|nr:hypothetical protein [Prevotella sp.]